MRGQQEPARRTSQNYIVAIKAKAASAAITGKKMLRPVMFPTLNPIFLLGIRTWKWMS
jgi:hypothetical protein